MIKKFTRGVLAAAAMYGMLSGSAMAEDKVVIGYFGNPTPMQVAAAEGKFKTATGWNIEWRKFSSGTDVIAAMASGDVSVAELGSSPLAIAASQGVELQLFMIAQVIGEAESLIVRNGSGIEKVSQLKGKRIAVPIGSTAHFSLMGALNYAGIDEKDVTIMNMSPDQIAAAWQQKAIDAAFIWQPVQSQILKDGSLLVGADKTAEWGYPTFDGWVVNTKFAQKNPKSMVTFIREMDEANQAFLKNPSAWTATSAPVKTIAARTGAEAGQVPGILNGFTFLPISEQVKPNWLGGSIAKAIESTAKFLKSAGRIESVASDYGRFVNIDLAKAAAQ